MNDEQNKILVCIAGTKAPSIITQVTTLKLASESHLAVDLKFDQELTNPDISDSVYKAFCLMTDPPNGRVNGLFDQHNHYNVQVSCNIDSGRSFELGVAVAQALFLDGKRLFQRNASTDAFFDYLCGTTETDPLPPRPTELKEVVWLSGQLDNLPEVRLLGIEEIERKINSSLPLFAKLNQLKLPVRVILKSKEKVGIGEASYAKLKDHNISINQVDQNQADLESVLVSLGCVLSKVRKKRPPAKHSPMFWILASMTILTFLFVTLRVIPCEISPFLLPCKQPFLDDKISLEHFTMPSNEVCPDLPTLDENMFVNARHTEDARGSVFGERTSRSHSCWMRLRAAIDRDAGEDGYTGLIVQSDKSRAILYSAHSETLGSDIVADMDLHHDDPAKRFQAGLYRFHLLASSEPLENTLREAADQLQHTGKLPFFWNTKKLTLTKTISD